MRALSKLIYLYNPDLVLFVGEALVGNDAVDQLSKFNQVEIQIHAVHLRLSFIYLHVKLFSYRKKFSCSCRNWPIFRLRLNPRLMDGTFLTKFDTIDDKVNNLRHGC